MLRSIAAVSLTLCICINCEAETTYNYVSGKKFATTVTEGAVAKAPAWKADAEDPPLSARKALASAKVALRRLLPAMKEGEFTLSSLSLTPLHGTGWYWAVTFQGQSLTGFPPTLRIVVLMDGAVVEPVVTEDSRKK